ncbi:AraC family transcriptional regulator, partial [Staphylococcus succinus]
MISSISIRNHYSTELARCINETMILIPLGDPCKLFLNGAVVTIEDGIIINNADLYQLLDVHNLIEIKIPLPLFMTRDAYLVNAYFDFNRIK